MKNLFSKLMLSFAPRKSVCAATAAAVSLIAVPWNANASACSEATAKRGMFVDGASRTTYFNDVVIEFERTAAGGAMVAFAKSARRYEIRPGEKAFLQAARASFVNQVPVHAAVAEPVEALEPSPESTGRLPALLWVDRSKPHASCAK